ncbi:MAG TPA: CbtA family protein [Burkholderiales bacterium]|nr:CbtA family protein [Burkholderiales bacterium]
MPLTVLRERAPSLRGLLLPALIAGLAAGAVAWCLQQLFLVPLILRAEALESAAQAHAAAGAGVERAAYSLLFTCVGACGFALLLAGSCALRGEVSWRRGLLWGLAGFLSFSLAPALGLAPELPGAHAADLVARQLWWITAALATAAGLACIVFPRSMALKLLGIALIALPHLIGAPRGVHSDDVVPPDLARAFVAGSLAVSAMMWLILGGLTPALMRRYLRQTV